MSKRALRRFHTERYRLEYLNCAFRQFRSVDGVEWWKCDVSYRPFSSSPSWWIHDFMTVPARQRERALNRAIVSGRIDPDEATYPLARKPHKYYW